MSDLETKMRERLTLALVQRDITCRVTGEVLDIRTCAVLVDPDGDPAYVLSPEGYAQLVVDGTIGVLAESYGYTLQS